MCGVSLLELCCYFHTDPYYTLSGNSTMFYWRTRGFSQGKLHGLGVPGGGELRAHQVMGLLNIGGFFGLWRYLVQQRQEDAHPPNTVHHVLRDRRKRSWVEYHYTRITGRALYERHTLQGPTFRVPYILVRQRLDHVTLDRCYMSILVQANSKTQKVTRQRTSWSGLRS